MERKKNCLITYDGVDREDTQVGRIDRSVSGHIVLMSKTRNSCIRSGLVAGSIADMKSISSLACHYLPVLGHTSSAFMVMNSPLFVVIKLYHTVFSNS